MKWIYGCVELWSSGVRWVNITGTYNRIEIHVEIDQVWFGVKWVGAIDIGGADEPSKYEPLVLRGGIPE